MLLENIRADLNQSLKAGDKQKVSCLRMVIAAAQNRQIELRRELTDDDCLAILKGQVKQISDSLEQFSAAGREDLAGNERENLGILKSYLPAELSSVQIEKIVDDVIAELGATKKDFGKVMKAVLLRVAGQADGKAVNNILSKKFK